ncbi:hypothetical protein DFQ01_11939 [Paenibacillus cellulosilyticus]|uniref:DUF402 domain-containing protein n=1 Tax=Paenibacillus cellulosilyticus TaxID=375489 RepID=A0A2V2YYB6_9BACL|nr:DUF402 domain-containing protein [Paenibacillus cellulosilyticus]PWV97957.1 hypothetical protein DFQ01_11939 [Paenibacillus cellulosilyticus]QKS44011.1 DUF402 domain-containing protein [Paenibacillus cellulosilyticus]
MNNYMPCMIKSFKHNGRLHRFWHRNWLVPKERLAKEHAEQSMNVLINRQTPIQEADGKLWTSRVPAVSFFIPGEWFNVVALLEDNGIRYYCNVASPMMQNEDVFTYIDYDLDVIRTADGGIHVVDRDEYERHKQMYHYPDIVLDKVEHGLQSLLRRARSANAPFDDNLVYQYYEDWRREAAEGDFTEL